MNLLNASSSIKNYSFTHNSFLPKIVTISLSQESNVEYQVIVKKDDVVKEGSVIAKSINLENQSFIHSSVPGKVLGIVSSFLPNGKQDFAVKIQVGGEFSYLGHIQKENNLDELSDKNILEKILNCGIINTFFTKKTSNLANEIINNQKKNLIIRLYDDDINRLTDSLMAKFYFTEIVKGSKAIAKALNTNNIVFVVGNQFYNLLNEKDKQELLILKVNLKSFIRGTKRNIIQNYKKIISKKDKLFLITKDDVFIDSSTAYEAYKSVFLSIPSVSKSVHFTGECLYSSCFLDVRIGSSINDIVKQIGGFVKMPSKIVINGEILGNCVQSLNVPITKYVKSVKFIAKKSFTDNHIYSCINCGNCRAICSINLYPDIIYNNLINFQPLSEDFINSAQNCISCGKCNTVCPSRLPLYQTIFSIKSE